MDQTNCDVYNSQILGHLIYKRWNPETKEAYAGKCWWTSPKQTPKKAFLKRQKDHEKNGMEGWNSEILTEVI